MELSEEIGLLQLLADGEYRSGPWLAQRLGISRAAVWKRMGKLGERGVAVERVAGRGYRLAGGIELLDRDSMLSRLPLHVRSQLSQLQVRRVVESTNALALEGLRSGTMGHATALFAEQQTGGRGRRGRPWVSPFARNIYCSLVWQFADGVAALEGLSLVIGMGVVRALTRAGCPGVMLKWPNDLVSGDAKLGGILIELDGDLAGPVAAVIGIGINVSMPASDAAAIDQPWVDLHRLCGHSVSRNTLACELIGSCFDILAEFRQHGFGHFLGEWAAVDALRGRQVSVSGGSGMALHGTAQGIDAGGALLVDTPDGVHRLSGGEISVRREA